LGTPAAAAAAADWLLQHLQLLVWLLCGGIIQAGTLCKLQVSVKKQLILKNTLVVGKEQQVRQRVAVNG
jgi:hypothetical protein